MSLTNFGGAVACLAGIAVYVVMKAQKARNDAMGSSPVTGTNGTPRTGRLNTSLNDSSDDETEEFVMLNNDREAIIPGRV